MGYSKELLEKGYFSRVKPPMLVDASIESACNLHCKHCYWADGLTKSPKRDWSSQLVDMATWDSELLYAGRILSPQGAKFIQDFHNLTGKKVGIIDNGYTIFKYPQLLSLYDYVNISIDGIKEDHDLQRGKAGASEVAWNAIFTLKEVGLDPTVSSCISPLNIKRWHEFETLLHDSDTPLSCTPVLGFDENMNRMSMFSPDELIEMLEILLGGVPKLINLLSPEHMEVLLPILKEFQWEIVDDGYATVIDGVLVKYKPYSLSTILELNLLWDGKFYAFMDVLTAGKSATEHRVLKAANSFAEKEHLIVKALFE